MSRGDTMGMMMDSTNPNFQAGAVGPATEFVTLSIGSTEIDLAKILQTCVYGLASGGPNCTTALQNARNMLYSPIFFNNTRNLFSEILGRMDWNDRPRKRTAIYVTGYPQFFDVNPGISPDQCDGVSFRPPWIAGGPKISKELRVVVNELTHELNYMLQLYIGMMNAQWSDSGHGVNSMFANAIDFADVDVLYTNHRFCRDGANNNPIIEPATKDTSVWFYHLGAPERALAGFTPNSNDVNTRTTAQQVEQFWNMTAAPGTSVSTIPNWVLRTFLPTPEGMQATEQYLLNWKLNFPLRVQDTVESVFNVMVVGDDICYGHEDPDSDEYQGFMPHLDAIFRDYRYYGYSSPPPNFDNARLQFIGSNRHPNNPFRSHECYESYSINEIASKVINSPALKQPGKIVVVMAGSIDFFARYDLDTAIQRLQNLINIIIQFGDQEDVILVSQIPQFGPMQSFPNMTPLQQAIAVYNARISGLVNQLRAEGRRVRKVHSSVTPADFMDNAMMPNAKGYTRMAYDIAEAIVLAEAEYGVGKPVKLSGKTPNANIVSRNTTGGQKTNRDGTLIRRDTGIPIETPNCTQPRSAKDAIINAQPSGDDIMASILRGYASQDEFIQQIACNATAICKMSLDGLVRINFF
jgi:hypothetical protein